ncbi:MAG: hypothetical protein WCS84_12590 [Nocardioides sp.]|jgi:hypothetical protein
MIRKFTLALVAFSLLATSAAAQPFTPDIQRIGTSDGVHVDAASPLPVTAVAFSVLTTALAAPGAAVPSLAALAGLSDGFFLRPFKAVDLDSGAGSDYYQGIGLMLKAAGGAAFASGGAGAVDTGTLRTNEATDSALAVNVDSLTTNVLDTIGAEAGGTYPTKAVQVGGMVSGGASMWPLQVVDLDTDAGAGDVDYFQGFSLRFPASGAGAVATSGAGDSTAATLRVVDASIGTGTSNQTEVNAAEVAVLAAKAGRRFARVQVYADVDGGVCCALGATTNACADGILLDASPAAGKAGGSAEWEGYGGAITCRAAGAWTVTVASEEW